MYTVYTNLITLPVVMVSLAISILLIVTMWKIFEKAGKPGWGIFVPLYSAYCLAEIAWGNGWLFLLCFVPVVNVIFPIITIFKLSKTFGRGVLFGFGLLFFSVIFYPILAFGDAEYIGPQ